MSYRLLRKAAVLLLALVLTSSAGCAAALIGAAAAGAGAAGYLYYNGAYTRDFPATLADTREAVRAALADLQFPIVKDSADAGTASIKTRTADGHDVWVSLDVVHSAVPKEGALTRVKVRVGFSGDEHVSKAILDNLAGRLKGTAPPPSISPAVPPVVPLKAELAPPQPPVPPAEKPKETPPPPIATTPSAVPAKK